MITAIHKAASLVESVADDGGTRFNFCEFVKELTEAVRFQAKYADRNHDEFTIEQQDYWNEQASDLERLVAVKTSKN